MMIKCLAVTTEEIDVKKLSEGKLTHMKFIFYTFLM